MNENVRDLVKILRVLAVEGLNLLVLSQELVVLPALRPLGPDRLRLLITLLDDDKEVFAVIAMTNVEG